MRAFSRWIVSLPLLAGCSSAYYATLEQFGVEKRDILVDRVEEGREAQDEAKQEFKDALEAFRALTGFSGGELGATYDRLGGALEDCEAAADDVRARIDAIEGVAEDLFDEWDSENEQYADADLKRKSDQLLRDTQHRYDGLIAAMRKAESTMEPVLRAFRDHVMFLKHNLNAAAIASLQGDLSEIEGDVARLVADMEKSIAEADAFIATLGTG